MSIESNPFPIVGIGASAGGLEAFLDLLRALPRDSGIAFILVQHLEPHHESQLTDILARVTSMPVAQAEDGMRVEVNHVYVIAPNTKLIIEQGVLHSSPRFGGANPNLPVDHFFESLAEDQGLRAIGVVLSGNGSDGSQGTRAIKSRDGVTFAQDERSAKYGGMPQNAIATGMVDFVLPPREIAQELIRISVHPYLRPEPREPAERDSVVLEGDEDLKKVFDLLSAESSVDFSQYKINTLRRRIARRMLVHHLSSVGEYLKYIEKQPSEISDLFQDVLITVTSFFREPVMFEALSRALHESVPRHPGEEAFRIWIAGCATGEEAYSVSMMVHETLESVGSHHSNVQLFGTDISETAINRARAGIYPESIQQNVSPERLRRFFFRDDSGYRVNKAIRESCVFARHDITRDAPFSQMDLVSCRNVLIYLDSAAQQRILPSLHYSLKPHGFLILGNAETIGSRSDLFSVFDKDNKIFAKKPSRPHFALDFPKPADAPRAAATNVQPPQSPVQTLADIEARAMRVLRDLYTPPAVIIDESMHVLHFAGQTSQYLQPAPGEASLNLLRLVRENLLFSLRKAVGASIERNEQVHETGLRWEEGGQIHQSSIRVIPITNSSARYFVVVFEESPVRTGEIAPPPDGAGQTSADAAPTPTGSPELQLRHAQRELSQTRDYLRQLVEEHEAATEELKAANEEVRSSNEELQSTNEELRTAKEELQSINEELITVNDELEHRNQELHAANSDLSNVLDAANLPIIMVGSDLRLRRYTRAAERILKLVPADIGRPVENVRHTMEVPDLKGMLVEASGTLVVQHCRAQSREGRWYSVYARPYRTIDNRIEGAVATFIDVDDATRALERAEQARDFAEAIVETVQHPLLVLDADLRIQRASAAFFKVFQVTPEETNGRIIYDIGNRQWNLPNLRALLEGALVHDIPMRDLDIEHDFPGIGRRIMRLNARRLIRRDQKPQTLLLAIEDITERRQAAEIQYRRLFESAKDGFLVVDAESGQIVDVNPYFSELSRYPRSELVGRPFHEIAAFGGAEQGARLVAESRENDLTRYESVTLQARDGRKLVVDIVATSYRVNDRRFIQINVRDVTERKRAEDALRRSNLDLQQFAFAASHDLQEPLRTIISYLQLIEKEYSSKFDEEAGRMIHFVTSAADRMRNMVLDLLSFSQIAQAKVDLGPVNMEAVLATALLNLQMAIQGTGARISFDPLPTLWIDQSQLLQLLQNLIGNALKYRSAEPPRIHISADQLGPEWIISVKDNGLGIDPRYTEHIFTVFKRLHGRDYPGTGIGLAICKRIVERHGGRIWVESESGKGSTFFVALPAKGDA